MQKRVPGVFESRPFYLFELRDSGVNILHAPFADAPTYRVVYTTEATSIYCGAVCVVEVFNGVLGGRRLINRSRVCHRCVEDGKRNREGR